MATVKTKKKTKAPSPAQMRARRKFAAAAKARAKAARAAKRLAAGGKRLPAKKKPAAKKRTTRRNAEHRDAQHPIHVTDYWQGRKGYKTQWQRAHEAGQRQLFGVKNPTAPQRRLQQGAALYDSLSKASRDMDDHLRVLYLQAKDARGKGWQQKRAASYIRRLAKHRQPLTVAQANNVALYLKHVWGFNGTKRANGSNTALAQKRRQEWAGRPSKRLVTAYAPKGSGAKGTLTAMGKLKRLKLKGKGWIDLKGVPRLAHNPKSNRMFVLGKEYSMKLFKKHNPEGVEDIGEVTHIEYEEIKTQMGDTAPVVYVHEFGEEGGERPHALVNEENLLILEGGDYYITPEGIRD